MSIIDVVKMIKLSDLRDAVNTQYGLEVDSSDIILALGKDTWCHGAYEIYIGPDRELSDEDPLDICVFTYLRDILPYDEWIFIDFNY